MMKIMADVGFPGLRLVLHPSSFIVVVLLCGCSKEEPRIPVYPVQGKVLFQGKPASNALVVFHPVGESERSMSAHGHVQADGSFRLSTYVTDDGAAAGIYAVTITWPETSPGKDPDENSEHAIVVDKLRGQYANPKKPFQAQVEIKAGDNQLEPFELK